MRTKKRAVSDFRYDTGRAAVPWAAVGENVRGEDISGILKFLIRPAKGRTAAYRSRLAKVKKDIAELSEIAQFAGKLTLGEQVQALERKCAKFLKVKHAVFLTNCTAGFEIGYKFAGLRPGDEVIAPAITFIATIAYPLSIGARVVLADVDPRTLNMDPADVAGKVTGKTKVIIPVHLGGYPVDMDPIMKLARRRGIIVIEDAAHAFGAVYKGKMAGAIGHFGAFSFHEVKNVTSLGEGGILCTDTPFGKQFAQARFLGLNMARQIPDWLYDVDALRTEDGLMAAGNHSATEIQALCLISQMDRIRRVIGTRRAAAAYLNRRLRGVRGILTPPGDDAAVKSTHHLYLLQVDPQALGADIQALKTKFQERGIVQIPHFAPLYKFSVMKQLGYDTAAMQASCPVAEEAFRHRFTHLPLYPLSAKQLAYMADAVIESVRELAAGR